MKIVQETYVFLLPIGDWADDGHGKYTDFLIKSNYPIERVTEAHTKIACTTGINLGDFCRKYDDNKVPDKVWSKLKALGFTNQIDEYPYVDQWELADIWLFLLQYVDSELKLERCDIPILRACVGYGLFS